ncbi:uncharacterized protein LOC21388598 [Morus notabilis]|uniref:uncharacterized protein LOC21388598 n=1 Tax=Morus notabilis TaxID=981085 RepID=UPI000CED3AA4|nr:uncharacterized protein LOC21388598 [Morus notabilis]
MPGEDVRSRKERILSVARKVVDNVNAMSFTNLDDQQVHSLMMMREIARGILCNRVEKVSMNDVKKALSSSIEKMVGSCKDVNSILSKIPCEGMDDEQARSVSRMKEIASTIVTRRAKIKTSQHRQPVESVDRVDAETVESKVGGASATSNKDTDIKMLQRRLFENEGPEAEADTRNEEGRNENQDSTIDGLSHSGNGDVQVGAEQGITVVDGETDTVQSGQTEGLMFKDVQVVVDSEVSAEDGRNEMQETVYETSKVSNEDGQNEVIKSTLLSPLQLSLIWPPDGKITLEWVKTMMEKLEQSSKDPPTEFWSLMPISVVDNLIDAASSILSKEPNCVEVDCCGEESKVVVVGDVEGHFHDLLNIFNLAGLPSENQFYVFNGNYVDRGAWGVEVFLVLLAWKVLMPNRVYLLRGNHETKFCTLMYGFEQEVKTKYGDQGEMVFNKCLECFKELPLASIIAGCVYTTHGGLFRSTHIGPLRRSKRKRGPLRRCERKRAQILELGSLEDLSKINRFLIDASLEDLSILTDILWSDPSKEDGLFENADRRMGLSWGPDCTETFLKESKLKLIIRSHQGPDARAGQDEFGDMLNGYSLDHDGESGKMYTLFSAPDYPQFGEPKYNNEGAYAVLKPPNFETPSFHSFKAVERPKLTLYGSSSSQVNIPPRKSAKVEFEALGISNPPSWSVQLADNSGGSQVVEVPRAPVVEGLPLPSDFSEAHKATFKYLFELVAGLKHMLSTRLVIESGVPVLAIEGSVPKENEGQMIESAVSVLAIEGSVPNENGGSVLNENEGSVLNENEVSPCNEKEPSVPNVSEGSVPNENERSIPNENKCSIPNENQGSVPNDNELGILNDNELGILNENEGSVLKDNEHSAVIENEGSVLIESEHSVLIESERSVPKENKEQEDNDVEMKPSEENDVEMKPSEDNAGEMKPSEDNDVEMKPSEDNDAEMKPSENA